MSESGDFDPGPWRGHDFSAAYSHYEEHAGRSYEDAVSSSKLRTDLLEAALKTKARNPLIIGCDITSSMGTWPTTIFSKLPYLELEAKEYLGDDLEIAFGAFGDAHHNERYPLQMRAFSSGTDLKARMEELVVEGGGGSGICETAELFALYCVHNVVMKKAIRPIAIIITDEKPYDFVSAEMAKEVAGVTLQSRVTTEDVFAQLKAKFSVYLIRKPYGSGGSGNTMSDTDREVRKRWIGLLGEEHVCDLPDPQRVVDVIFGILAKETGRIDYFREEIEGRQRRDQVKTVFKSLASIHKLPSPEGRGRAGASILKLDDKGRGGKTRKLI